VLKIEGKYADFCKQNPKKLIEIVVEAMIIKSDLLQKYIKYEINGFRYYF